MSPVHSGAPPLAPARGFPSLPHCAALRLCRPRGFPLPLRSVASPGRFPSPCGCYPRRRGPGPRRCCVNNNSKTIANPKGQNQMTIAISATYSPEDNKLRLYASSRLDATTYERVKAAGFKWAPKQDLFVAPMWTPSREDLCIELAGEIGDEDTTLVERAEVKADRLEDLSTRRAQNEDRAQSAVHAIADGIPFGQPILIGHHSERHARKDAEKIEKGMRHAVEMWKAAEYWQSRAKGAIRLAKYKESPDVRARRIKGLEASKRKEEKSQQEAEMWLKLWTAGSQEQDKKLQAQVALRIAGICHLNLGSSAHLVKLVRVIVFVRTGAVSGCMHDAYAQQIEFRASVHGAFDELQSVDVPFHRAVAPGLLQCSQHRGLVATKILCKGCQ